MTIVADQAEATAGRTWEARFRAPRTLWVRLARVPIAADGTGGPPILVDPGPGFVTSVAAGPAGRVAFSTTAGRGLETVLRVADGSGTTVTEVDHAPGAVTVERYSASGRV